MKTLYNFLIINLLPFFIFAQNTKIIDSPSGTVISNNGGSDIPHASAILDIRSTSKGYLIPRMNTFQRTLMPSTTKGLQVFDTNTNTFWFHDGTDWVEWRPSQWKNLNGSVSIMNTNIGIGISSPSEKLHVIGNIKNTGRIDADGVIEGGSLSSTGGLYINSTSLLQGAVTGSSTGLFYGKLTSNTGMEINDTAGLLNFRASSNDKGFLQLSGDNLRIGTYSTNTLGKFMVRTGGTNNFVVNSNGDSGFGIEDPTAKVHINSGASNTALTVQADAAPSLRLMQGGSYAFLQYNGADLRIAAAGNKVVLSNVLYADDASNRVGIGTISPTEKLHVTGNALVSGNSTVNGTLTVGTNAHLNAGKLTHETTSTSYNLLPVCYGRVNSNGTKAGGTPNFTCEKSNSTVGAGTYHIYSPQITTSSVVMVTCKGDFYNFPLANVNVYDGYISVFITDEGSFEDHAFHFLIFDP